MFYSETAPPSDLEPWVHSFWSFSSPPDRADSYEHRVLPDGCVLLVWMPIAEHPEGGALLITGPRMSAMTVDVAPGDSFFGVRFRPGEARSVLPRQVDVRLPDLQNVHLPLQHLDSPLAHKWSERLRFAHGASQTYSIFEEEVREWSGAADQTDGRIRTAVLRLYDGSARIASLAAEVALSERQFQRVFRYRVGLTPKQYARIRRFRGTLANILCAEPHTWGRVATDCGFADQAHLTREFTAFFGAPPEALRAHVAPIAHGTVLL